MANKFISVVAIILGVCVMANAQQELTKGQKDTVYVGDLIIAPSVTELNKGQGKGLQLNRISETLQSQFISALNGTRQFQLVDRKRLNAIREEQKLAQLGQIDPNDKNVAQSMKMAGAKYVFLPQLDGFEDRTETLQYQEVGRSSVNRKVFLSAVVQIEDTTTSGIMPDAPTVQLERMETMSMVQQGALMESDKFLVMLAKDMANQLCQKVVAVLRPAKVLDVTGKQIMINRGTEAGFNQGDLLEVYTAQDIVDDDTGEKFRKEIPIGKARLVRVDSRQGFALIEGEDMGIQKGCIVRTVQPSSRTVTKAVGDLDDASKPEPANNVDSLSPGSSEKPIKF